LSSLVDIIDGLKGEIENWINDLNIGRALELLDVLESIARGGDLDLQAWALLLAYGVYYSVIGNPREREIYRFTKAIEEFCKRYEVLCSKFDLNNKARVHAQELYPKTPPKPTPKPREVREEAKPKVSREEFLEKLREAYEKLLKMM